MSHKTRVQLSDKCLHWGRGHIIQAQPSTSPGQSLGKINAIRYWAHTKLVKYLWFLTMVKGMQLASGLRFSNIWTKTEEFPKSMDGNWLLLGHRLSQHSLGTLDFVLFYWNPGHAIF